jgi:2-keto-4-pentenoate hydratase/2-oxohepta-3-ene-1,7-dioic acid hydratase in catechol pathway
VRLVTFELDTPIGPLQRVGAVLDDHVVDLQHAAAARAAGDPDQALREATAALPSEMLGFLEQGEASLQAAADALSFVERTGADTWHGRTIRHPFSSVRLRAPLPRPRSLRDFMVVEEHVKNALPDQAIPPEWYEMPVYYKGNVDAIYGPDDEIPWPRYTDRLDYELEICAVIGQAGREIPAGRAHEHIVGYTIYNDWSARDIQMREMKVGLGPALGKDFASSIGPAITTADAFDLHGARLTARIDGEQWSEGTLGPMRFTFAQIVEWVSQEQTLHPGDLLGSGTVGRGCGLELDRWLLPGSVVELSADGIGVLRNRVGEKR